MNVFSFFFYDFLIGFSLLTVIRGRSRRTFLLWTHHFVDYCFRIVTLFIIFYFFFVKEMSIVPLMFRDWWDDFDRPMSRLMDQHFGSGLNRDDLLSGLSSLGIASRPRSIFGNSSYYRPWRNIVRQNSGGASTISCDKDRFEVSSSRFFNLFFFPIFQRLCQSITREAYSVLFCERDSCASDILFS